MILGNPGLTGSLDRLRPSVSGREAKRHERALTALGKLAIHWIIVGTVASHA
jgi:hypothetical protein